MTCITHFPEEKTSLILQLQLNLSNGLFLGLNGLMWPFKLKVFFLQGILNFKVSCFNGQWPHPESLEFPPHLGLLEAPISQQDEPEGWRQAGRC